MGKQGYSCTNWSYHREAQGVIAHGYLTNSKRPESFVKGIYPTHIQRGKGVWIYDHNDNKWVDFICALGANLLGYANEEISEAIRKRLELGSTLSLSTDVEIALGNAIKENFSFVDRVRFLKTGTEACQAAITIARSYTSRDLVLSEGYHGWNQEFVSLTPPAHGVPKNTYPIGKLDPDFSNITSKVAAVIVEPVILDYSRDRQLWLMKLKKKCLENGTVLIFDEIITGLRFPKLCVAEHFSVYPDLICLGKAFGGGLPISIVGGREAIMNGTQYFVSGTFFGETLSMVAALKTLELLRTKYKIDDIWQMGAKFTSIFNTMWPEKIKMVGYPTRGVFEGDEMVKALLFQEACRAGILLGNSWFFTFDHRPFADATLSCLRDIISRIKTNSVKLEGELPKKPFAQQVREENK